MSLSPKAQWRTCVLFSHARPILRGRGTSVPIFLGTFYTLAHSVRNSNQILHGDQTILEENFYRVDHANCLAKNDGNADARSVCVS